MKKELLEFIICPACGQKFDLEISSQNEIEIREGKIACRNCKTSFEIKNGILNFLYQPSKIVLKEQAAHRKNDFLPTGIGMAFEDALHVYRQDFLKLPEGDNSDVFQRRGYFHNVSMGAENFYKSLPFIKLSPHSKILDCGADTCWASSKLSEMGHRCVAIDINHHLIASDIFIKEKKVYFERIIADMNNLNSFKSEIFDIVLTIASIHHTAKLESTLKGFWRVLKKKGKAVLINEPVASCLNFRAKDKFGGYEKEIGIHEQTFNILEYKTATKKAGFNFSVFIPKGRKRSWTWKHKFAYSLLEFPILGQISKNFLPLFQLPSLSVTMICTKNY